MNSTLLEIHLAGMVPLAILDLQRRGGPLQSDWDAAQEFGIDLGSRGDIVLYPSHRKGETAEVVSKLVRAMAVLAHKPGGVQFRGVVWCARHYLLGLNAPGPCPACEAAARPLSPTSTSKP
jgi:hypothetical protein